MCHFLNIQSQLRKSCLSTRNDTHDDDKNIKKASDVINSPFLSLPEENLMIKHNNATKSG